MQTAPLMIVIDINQCRKPSSVVRLWTGEESLVLIHRNGGKLNVSILWDQSNIQTVVMYSDF